MGGSARKTQGGRASLGELRTRPAEEGTLPLSSTRDSNDRLPAPTVDAETLLELGRTGTEDALEQLRQYSPEALALALCHLDPARRVEFLETAERVDEIVPLLPEADFTSTVRGAGIEESGWLVEFASPEQRVAAVDLDCWRDFRFSPSRLFDWIDAMIEAGPETLAASFDELDPEIWVLALRTMGDFSVSGLEDSYFNDGTSIDGMVYYNAYSAESEDRLQEILSTALHYAPSHFFRLVYGAIYESQAEVEEFAALWQRSRLADLGFPDRGQAMRAYAPLRVNEAPVLDVLPASDPGAVVTDPSRVPAQIRGSLLGDALAALSALRSEAVMNDILALANALAVADRLPLAERETVERSLAKAMRGIERGLAELARAQNLPLRVVLDATPPLDLFRIGATLDTELCPRTTLEELADEEEGADWGVELEMISEDDQTLRNDGRLKQF